MILKLLLVTIQDLHIFNFISQYSSSPTVPMHKTHGGHNVIKIRLAGGRNPTEGTLPLHEHISNGYNLKELTPWHLNAYLYIEGRVEVAISNNERSADINGWRPICGDGWGVREAMVS